jgi:hypothetical protein
MKYPVDETSNHLNIHSMKHPVDETLNHLNIYSKECLLKETFFSRKILSNDGLSVPRETVKHVRQELSFQPSQGNQTRIA